MRRMGRSSSTNDITAIDQGHDSHGNRLYLRQSVPEHGGGEHERWPMPQIPGIRPSADTLKRRCAEQCLGTEAAACQRAAAADHSRSTEDRK